jgi:hypothetical protein
VTTATNNSRAKNPRRDRGGCCGSGECIGAVEVTGGG